MAGKIFTRLGGRKQYRYRIDVTNDDTYSHIITFHISSKVVFWTIFSAFIGIVLFTAAIVMFSPLKYYLPGLNYVEQKKNIEMLKSTIDILQEKVEQQDKMYKTIQYVIRDDFKQIEQFDSVFFNNNDSLQEQ